MEKIEPTYQEAEKLVRKVEAKIQEENQMKLQSIFEGQTTIIAKEIERFITDKINHLFVPV